MIRKFLGKKWFFEDFLPGEFKTSTWGFQIEKVIYSEKSKFQKIEIFKTKEFDKVLILDGIIQLSTKDEFIYHEILVHPGVLFHQKPEKVLILGGGDGGALREIVKYRVKEIFLVDIDKKVIEISKKYLPSVSKGAFKDKRVKIFIEDASKFIKKYQDYFDIIIEDLTDPSQIAESCWNIRFYKDIFFALKENGIVSFQSGFLNNSFTQKIIRDFKKIFPFLEIRKVFIPSFPLDEQTFSLASKKLNFNKISFKKIEKKFKKIKLKTRYYNPKIHFCSKI
jgi:spermidine synthase